MNTNLKTNQTVSVFTPLVSANTPALLTFEIERPVDDETPADGP